MKNSNKTWKQTFAEVEVMHREGLKKQIQLWLDGNDLTSEEMEKIIQFCNGGDAIHSFDKDYKETKIDFNI